jgi:hypothetical protein
VSQTVAFVLVFALIVTSIGIVTTVGFDSIREVQRGEQSQVASRAMRSVGAEMNDVAVGDQPAHRATLRLSGGAVFVENRTSLRVQVNNTTFDRTYHPRELRYQFNDRNVSYVSGTLARGGSLLLFRPEMYCDPAAGHATVTVVRLAPQGGGAVAGGPITVAVRRGDPGPLGNATPLSYPVARGDTNATGVALTFDGPQTGAWDAAMTERGFDDADGDGTYECAADRVVVRTATLRVDLLT